MLALSNPTPGTFPTAVYQNNNYFRDVVFTSTGSTLALHDNATIFVSETAGAAIVTVDRIGSTAGQITLEYTTNEIGGAGAAQAGADYTQPTFNGRANTGQIVFADGETSKTIAIPILNDQNAEGNETFSVGTPEPRRRGRTRSATHHSYHDRGRRFCFGHFREHSCRQRVGVGAYGQDHDSAQRKPGGNSKRRVCNE